MECKAFERARPIRHVGGRHQQHMRQSLRVHADMAFDARDQLATVKTLLFRRIGILYALRVNDEETGFFVPTIALSLLANHFFLKPPQGYSLFHLHTARSNR